MISREDFPVICRICLGHYNVTPFEPKHLVVLSEINLEVDLTAPLPQNICATCANELENVERFIEKFDRSQNMLEKIRKMTVESKFSHRGSPMIQCSTCKRVFMRNGIKQHYRTNPQCMPQNSQDSLTNDHESSSLTNDVVNGSLTNAHVSGSLTNDHVSEINDHESGSLTDEHVSGSLTEDHVSGSMTEDHVNDLLTEDHVSGSLTEDHVNVLLTEDHVSGSLTEDHVSGSLTEDHVNGSLTDEHITVSLTNDDVSGSLTSDHLIGSLTNDHVGLTKRRPYKCKECSHEFIYPKNLKKHVLKCHSKNAQNKNSKEALKCEVCQKGFTRKRSLNDHMNLHTGETPYLCEYCGKGFARPAARNAHLYRFHSSQPDDGSQNKRKYVDNRVHGNYPCKICGRVLGSRSGYIYHQHLHKKMRTFLCDICGKTYITKSVLKIHLLTHTGEPFGCNTCGKRFKWRNSLNIHMREHIEDRSSTCLVCCKSFDTKEEFDDHVANHELMKCPLCKKSYLKQNMEKHIISHSKAKSYKCQLCEKSFTCPSHLINHQRTHSGEKPFQCTICGRSFRQPQTLKVHMKRHTGEKPYACFLCEKQFSVLYKMKLHVNRHHKVYIENNEETSEL